MPTIVELPDKTELEFPDGTDQLEMRRAISTHFPKFAEPLPSERPVIPAPGAVPPRMAAAPPPAPSRLGQVPTAVEQQQVVGPGPALTAEEAEQIVFAPIAPVPRFGKPGTVTRGLSELAGGAIEAVESPGGALFGLAQAVPGVGTVANALLAASLTKSAAQKAGEASVTGSPQTWTEAAGTGLLAGLGTLGAARPLLPITARTGELSPREVRKLFIEPATEASERELATAERPPEPAAPAAPTTKGEPSAIQERETTPLPVEVPPGDRGEVGAQVREQAPAVEVGGNAPTAAAAKTELGDVAAPRAATEGATVIAEEVAKQREQALIATRLEQLGIAPEQIRAMAPPETEALLRQLEAQRAAEAAAPPIPKRGLERLRTKVAEVKEGREAIESMFGKTAEATAPATGNVTISGRTTEGEPYHITSKGLYQREAGQWNWIGPSGEKLRVTDAGEIAKLETASAKVPPAPLTSAERAEIVGEMREALAEAEPAAEPAPAAPAKVEAPVAAPPTEPPPGPKMEGPMRKEDLPDILGKDPVTGTVWERRGPASPQQGADVVPLMDEYNSKVGSAIPQFVKEHPRGESEGLIEYRNRIRASVPASPADVPLLEKIIAGLEHNAGLLDKDIATERSAQTRRLLEMDRRGVQGLAENYRGELARVRESLAAAPTGAPAATTASVLERNATAPLTAPPPTAPLSSPSVRASSPTGGTATGIVPPATQSFVNALGALIRPIANLGQRIRLGWRAYAQEAMPRITAAHRETGEAGTRYTAAPMVGRQLGYSFADRVLEATGVDDAKFGVALKEDRLRAKRAALEAAGDDEGAAAVVTLVGSRGSPFANEAAYQAFLAEPRTQSAIDLFKRMWVSEKEPLYRQATDLDPDVELPGLVGQQTGAFINLTFNDARRSRGGVVQGATPEEIRQTATLLRRTPWSRRMKGTGTSYERSFRETMGTAFEREYPVAAQHEFIKSLIESGNARVSEKAYEPDLILNGVRTGESRQLRLKPWTGRFLHVRKDLLREYDHAVGFGERLTIPGITPAARFLTVQSLIGLGEGTAHSANLLMKAFTGLGPTSRPLVNALLKAVPGRPDLLATIPRVIFRGLTASRDEMLALAKIGAAKEGYRGVISSTFLNPIDRGIRLVSADIYRGLAERGIVPDTETGLREFVNEVGNYNQRTQSTLVRALRSTQVQPFATGFRTAQVQALRRGFLGPGTPATSTWNAAALRMDILGGYVGFIGTVVALNKILSAKAGGPPGTPLGAVGWVGDDGKTHVMDLGKLTGFTRSPVTAGVLSYAESRERGLDVGTSLKGAIRPAEASLTSQFAGPVVRTTTVALTGKSPYGRQEAPARPPTSAEMPAAEQVFRSQTAANIATALQEVNPLVNIALDRYEGKPMAESLQQQFTRWAPRTLGDVQTSEQFSRIVTRANVNQYSDWLAKEAKKRPVDERSDWVEKRMESDKVADEHRGAVMRRLRRDRAWSGQ